MSERPVVLLTNPIHPDGEAILAPQVRLVTAPDTEPDTLRSYAKNAAGIIVRAKLPDDIFKHAPHVRAVVRHGVSLDLIPLAAAKRRNIIVANLPGLNTETVAEYFFSALFHLRRPLGRVDTAFRTGGWVQARAFAEDAVEIGSTTVGIIGVGEIGKRIVRIARGFGMTVIGASRHRGGMPEGVEEVAVDELFVHADAIALCCALTDETYHIADGRRIGMMKPTAILVNMSHGPLVDAAAVIGALHTGAIGGAAIDVYDDQPLPPDSPLFGCPNLLMTPHVAVLTTTTLRATSIASAEEMLRILRGEPPRSPVNSG